MNNEAKKYDELGFEDDFMFCKIMQNNEELCSELLELIIGKKVRIIKYPEKQKVIEITSDGKGVRLDIYVEDAERKVYDIEMQTSSNRNLSKRSRYYQGMIDLNMIERGADYSELKQSFVIFICTFDYFKKGLHKYSFRNRCNEFPELELDDETEKIFLCDGGDTEDVSEEMRDFLKYLTNRKPTSEFTKKLDQEVKKAQKHEEWRQEYMSLLMRDQDNQKIGEARGIKIGETRGIKIGEARGIKIGGIQAMIQDNIEEHKDKATIISKLEKRFSLSDAEAEEYYQKYAN